ncbi:FxLYD domain-containing protein [Haloarcula mannanilytica]|nr:FxLYD domain-containing protein [Haloarcula mannanilytica]
MEVQYTVLDADAGHTYEVVAPDAGLEVGRSGLVEVDLGYDSIQMAEVAVTNTGGGIAGVATVTVDWFDANDDYLASTSVRTRGLRASETWLARASPSIDVDNDDAIDSFEVSPGQARPTTAFGPEGVTVSNAQHRASSEEVIVRASATNTRDTQIDYLEFVGKVYNDADEVIGHYWTNETEVSAGETVRFEGNPNTNGRSGQVTAHEILLTTEAL